MGSGVLDFLANEEFNHMTTDVLPALIQKGVVAIYKTDAFWEPLRHLRYYWDLNLGLMRGDYGAIDPPGRPIIDDMHVGEKFRWPGQGLCQASGPVLIGNDVQIKKNGQIVNRVWRNFFKKLGLVKTELTKQDVCTILQVLAIFHL